jgi:hypothetical protein
VDITEFQSGEIAGGPPSASRLSGILANVQPGSVHISSITISVALSQNLQLRTKSTISGLFPLLFSEARKPPKLASCSLSSPALTMPSSAALLYSTRSASTLSALESSLRRQFDQAQREFPDRIGT